MTRPLEMALRLGWYIAKNKLTRHKRFPLVTMLELLEKWNFACERWGEFDEQCILYAAIGQPGIMGIMAREKAHTP
jgi:hypothetical protein